MSLVSWSIVVSLLAVASAPGTRVDGPSSPRDSTDCGMYALYHLLRLEGVTVQEQSLLAVLPRSHPDGFSMLELREAAAELGFKLQGASLGREPGAIDRPMLAFLKLRERGHYVVVRPVGHTGRLVQVIDDIGDPLIVDSAWLIASPGWTGNVLISGRTNWPVILACGLLMALILVVSASSLPFKIAKRLASGR